MSIIRNTHNNTFKINDFTKFENQHDNRVSGIEMHKNSEYSDTYEDDRTSNKFCHNNAYSYQNQANTSINTENYAPVNSIRKRKQKLENTGSTSAKMDVNLNKTLRLTLNP